MQDLRGKHLGKYTLIEPIGEGGMGQIYRAYQASIERDVAVKILPENLTKDPVFLRRFEQEAKLIARLQHPHILSVYDFGEEDGFIFLVMPLMNGGTLGDLIQGKPLPWKDIRRIMLQVGSALDYAHEHGLIHRDIKPTNILMDDSKNCLLSDFGLVKELEENRGLTESGIIVGTPTYMSPEQGLGDVLDRRSDIYALGVIFYELVTGQVPFTADSPVGVVIKHINEPLPAPQSLNPAVPASISAIIYKALAKNPDDRYATVCEFVRDIQDAIPESGELSAVRVSSSASNTSPGLSVERVTVTVDDGKRRSRSRGAIATSIAVVMLLIGTGAFVISSNRPETDVTSTSIPETAIRICYNSAARAVPPGTFDGEIWRGIRQAADNHFEIDLRTIPSNITSTSATAEAYRKNMNDLIDSGCKLIITAGFNITDLVAEAARTHPEIKFQFLDGEFDPPIDNIWAVSYATDEGAFLAGYAAASITGTGKVATFGGFQFPSVEGYMDGFARGVAYYNEQHNTEVEVLGWDIATRSGIFINSFASVIDGDRVSSELIEDGADIILPVAGKASLGAADSILEHNGVLLIGTDSDWSITNPKYTDIILTSVEKRWNVSELAALDAIRDGKFEGGTHTGNITNGEVGISPFREFDNLISTDIDAELVQIKADIITGKIQTHPADPQSE